MNTLAAFIRLAPRSCTLRGSAFLSPRACIFNLLGQRAGRVPRAADHPDLKAAQALAQGVGVMEVMAISTMPNVLRFEGVARQSDHGFKFEAVAAGLIFEPSTAATPDGLTDQAARPQGQSGRADFRRRREFIAGANMDASPRVFNHDRCVRRDVARYSLEEIHVVARSLAWFCREIHNCRGAFRCSSKHQGRERITHREIAFLRCSTHQRFDGRGQFHIGPAAEVSKPLDFVLSQPQLLLELLALLKSEEQVSIEAPTGILCFSLKPCTQSGRHSKGVRGKLLGLHIPIIDSF